MTVSDGTLAYRVGELESDFNNLRRESREANEQLQKKLDRLLWAILTLTITIASAAVVFALTILSTRR